MNADFFLRLGILSVGLGLAAISAGAQEVGYPLISAYSSTEIGVDARSWVTVQDHSGVLHFGCDALVDFDGERWSATPLREAYALRGLDYGPDGRLWFAAAGDIGWFERGEGGDWKLHSLRAELPDQGKDIGEVWHVFAETHGAVFVAADKIMRWDGKQFRSWSMPDARRLPAMRVGGVIYVYHQPTGLYALDAGEPRLVIPATVLGDAGILWMEPRRAGWLLATARGLFTYEDETLRPFAPEASDYIHRNSLTAAVRLPDGRLVLGTYRGGLVFVRRDGSVERILTQDDGLPTQAIYSLFVDRDGGLWVTSPSHIFHLATSSTSVMFDARAGLPDLPCLQITRDAQGIVVANDRGVFRLQVDGQHVQPLAPLGERLMDLRATERGLLATTHSKVELLTPGGPVKLFAGVQNPFVSQPSRQWPGFYLISVGRSIILAATDGASRTLVRDLPDIATSIAEDDSGELWIGTIARGILTCRPNLATAVEAESATEASGLPAFSGSGVVVSIPGRGLLALARVSGWFKGSGAARFERITSYPSREVVAVADAALDDGLWIVHPAAEGHGACVARIAVSGGHALWQPHAVVGLPDIGAPRSIFAERSPDQGSIVWIGGTKGILRTTVASGPTAPAPRMPLLRAVADFGDRGAARPIVQALPYATRSVSFEFAALEFARRAALRMETRVDEIDAGWVPADASSQRELSALRDGRYTFRVRTVAETGIAGDAAEFNFEILPPWWRTTPALVGAALGLGLVTFGAFRLRVRSLRQRNAELEEKVHERTEQLAQASAAKTQFVANMSHDIRNPLNGIVGLAIALEDSRLDRRQREMVATLRECTTYLSSLVDDVLDFASIEAGRVVLRPGPFAPEELLRSIMVTLAADATQHGATLTVEGAPGLPATLLGDAGRIQQILVNYVSNALKYAGGPIRLSACVPHGATGEIEFAVTDEGPGISDAEQAVLFTKFTRLSNSRDAQIKGAGLGLASCRLLADIMDGSVGVESQPGRGARFFLRLPLAVCAAAPEEAGFTLPQANVLVVEDADYNAWAAAAVLSRLGLAHVRARTGAEALQLFSEKRFNIVLLDHNLPDMPGTDVARRMRELEPDGPRAILLAVTAYCTAEDRARCLDAGMDAFVGKPLTPEKLRKVLITAGRQLLTAASVHAPSDTRSPALDLSLLGYLADGTEQGLLEQVERFLVALGEADEQLARSAASREFDAIADSAHLVLSQARLIGCTALVEATIALERAAREKEAASLPGLLAQAHREIATLTGALRYRHRAVHPA